MKESITAQVDRILSNPESRKRGVALVDHYMGERDEADYATYQEAATQMVEDLYRFLGPSIMDKAVNAGRANATNA